MKYLGDFQTGVTLDFKFFTKDSTGAGAALTGGAVSVYKGNNTTESTSGVTLTANFDGVTGLNNVNIDLSSSGAFYTAASNFQVVLTSGTVSAISAIGYVLAEFSVQNRYYGAASDPWLTSLPGAYGAGTAGKIVGDNVNATISSRSTYAGGPVASVTGDVGGDVLGDVIGSVGSVLTPVSVDVQIHKNQDLDNFTFPMFSSTTHQLIAGLTVSSTVSIDGAAFVATTNAVTDTGNGFYSLDLTAADLNGDVIALKFTASGADDNPLTIVTQP